MEFVLLGVLLFLLYLLLSWITVFFFRPRCPRHFFLLYWAVLSGLYIFCTTRGAGLPEDQIQLAAWFSGLIFYTVCCFTMWNSFYSILWGFSGGLLADFCANQDLCHVDSISQSYSKTKNLTDAPQEMDRMLNRRIPGLIGGGYLKLEDGHFKVEPKGKTIAILTLVLYSIFALGKGGGITVESTSEEYLK